MITALALALVKNEGFVFLIAIIVPLYLMRRRSIKPLLPALGADLAWAVSIRVAGAESDPWLLTNVLPWSADFFGEGRDHR